MFPSLLTSFSQLLNVAAQQLTVTCESGQYEANSQEDHQRIADWPFSVLCSSMIFFLTHRTLSDIAKKYVFCISMASIVFFFLSDTSETCRKLCLFKARTLSTLFFVKLSNVLVAVSYER
jgi:hypothetical protein